MILHCPSRRLALNTLAAIAVCATAGHTVAFAQAADQPAGRPANAGTLTLMSALTSAVTSPAVTSTVTPRIIGPHASLYTPEATQVALLPRPGGITIRGDGGIELVRKKRTRGKKRARRQASRRGGRQPECKSWKYHGADRAERPYNPEQYIYTEEYKRNPGRPSRAEAARIAEERFPQMVNDKVLRMLELVNKVRTRRGHTTMKLEPRLMVAAKRHNLDIARYALMQHTGTDCSQLADRVWDAGYTWTKIAENLAGGNLSAVTTMRQWTGSSRHLMQMTLPGMTEAGIAYDYNPNPPRSGIPIKHFWTLILARPDPWRDRRWKAPENCKGMNC